MNSEIKSIWTGAAVLALLVYAGAAFAQPPGGPPGAGGPPDGVDGRDPLAPPPLHADAPQPSSNPRNFDGRWYHESPLLFQITTDMFGYKTPFNDAGRKVVQRPVKSLKYGTPFINASARCIPMGQP